jgi:hypothetical protein
MGVFYVLSSKDLESTFWSEKFVSVLMFAALSAWLGWKIFRAPGLLMGIWALTSKYVLFEPNGTHALATSVAMSGALCFFLPWKQLRLPSATLLLFLSTQVRQDMWGPFLVFCGLVVMLFVRDIWKGSRKLTSFGWASLVPWLAVVVIGASLYSALTFRTIESEPHRVNVTFGQYYAYQYVQRHGLQSKYPDPWVQWLNIVKESMPDLADPALISPIAVARRYPSEFMAHLLFNLKMALRAVPAMAGGLSHPVLFLFCSVGLGVWYFLSHRGKLAPRSPPCIDAETRQHVIVWMIALTSLIPLAILMAPAARTLIPLVPAEMILVGFLTGQILNHARFPRRESSDDSQI